MIDFYPNLPHIDTVCYLVGDVDVQPFVNPDLAGKRPKYLVTTHINQWG